MGGKGIRRREKNYRAAHGGITRLPPISATSSIDAIPSKLRQIMAFSEMKKKHKKANADEHMDFLGHEKIQFCEVVEAPPKLAVSKAFKNNAHDALK